MPTEQRLKSHARARSTNSLVCVALLHKRKRFWPAAKPLPQNASFLTFARESSGLLPRRSRRPPNVHALARRAGQWDELSVRGYAAVFHTLLRTLFRSTTFVALAALRPCLLVALRTRSRARAYAFAFRDGRGAWLVGTLQRASRPATSRRYRCASASGLSRRFWRRVCRRALRCARLTCVDRNSLRSFLVGWPLRDPL